VLTHTPQSVENGTFCRLVVAVQTYQRTDCKKSPLLTPGRRVPPYTNLVQSFLSGQMCKIENSVIYTFSRTRPRSTRLQIMTRNGSNYAELEHMYLLEQVASAVLCLTCWDVSWNTCNIAICKYRKMHSYPLNRDIFYTKIAIATVSIGLSAAAAILNDENHAWWNQLPW